MANGRTRRRRARRRKKSLVREWLELILAAIVTVLVLRTFLVQAFRIPSASMEDTLLVGDFLLANKFIYGAKIPFTDWRLPALREPKPGDIIIFQYPEDPSRDFIKRCIGTPGQTVEVRKVPYVNRARAVDPPLSKYMAKGSPLPIDHPNGARDNFGPVVVPPGHVFVMGDNRDNSEDSRYWGFLPYGQIKGKAFLIYASWAPDADAPEYEGLSSIPKMLLYNLIRFPKRIRWERIGRVID